MKKKFPAREEIRCTPKQKNRWQRASELADAKDRAQWERDTLDAKADALLASERWS